MAEDLGTAVLRVTVDSREALAAIETLRENLGRGFGNPAAGLFRGIEEQARAAGTRAGRALRDAISSISQGLDFRNIGEALDFQGALNGSIRDLRQYREALVSLRDGTSAATPGFSQLNDVIAEVGRTIRNFSASSDDLVADLQRQRQAASSPELAQLADLYRNLERTSASAARGQAQLSRSQQGVRAVGEAAQQANPAVRQLQQLLASLQNAGTSFDARNLRQISDEAAASGLSVQQFTRSILNGQTPLANTTAGLQQQARAFQTLAAFTKVGTAEFNNFTQAAAKASQKQLFAGFDELKALRQQFQVGRAVSPTGGISQDSFRGTEELLQFARRLEQTPAAINLYIQALEQAQAVTLTTDQNLGELTAEIDRQRTALAAATQTANAYSRVLQLTAEQQSALAQSFRNAANVNGPLALPSSELLAQRVQRDGGRQPRQLSLTEPNLVNNAGLQAARDYTQSLLDSARATNTLEREAQQLAATLQVLRRGAELRLPALPPSQQFVFDPNAPEDPAVLRAEERNRRRQAKIAGITDYAFTGGRDDLAGIVPRTAAVVGANTAAIKSDRDLQQQRRKTAQETARATQREADARRKRRSDAIGSGLIGGAFPLLFGQGVGASVGGGIGGIAGGLLGGQFGFGLSLVGTAVGAQIDALTQRFIALGEALRNPIANLDKFIQEATLASKSQEALVKALAETGQTQAAADLIRSEASRTLDPVAAEGAAATQDEFNRALSDTRDVLGTIVSGPATGFLEFLTAILRIVNGTPAAPAPTPEAQQFQSRQNAANRAGLSVGALASGILLTAGVAAAGITSGGLATPVAAGLIGTGLSLTGFGAAGARSAGQDLNVAQSGEVLKAELGVEAAKKRQVALENQILNANAAGKDGLKEQLSLQAQFNALAVEEAEARSRIAQESARNEDGAEAKQAEREVTAAIEIRRKALIATASAAQEGAAQELRNAKELVGVYGTQRQILEEQLKIRKARESADQAQQQFNQSDLESREGLGKLLNKAILNRDTVELLGQDAIQKLRQNAADNYANTVTNSFDIATDLQRQQARNIFNQQIQSAINSGSLDIARAGRKYNALPTYNLEAALSGRTPDIRDFSTQYLDLDKLAKLAGEAQSLQNAEKNLFTAIQDNSKAITDLTTKNWNVTVNVDANGQTTASGDLLNKAIAAP